MSSAQYTVKLPDEVMEEFDIEASSKQYRYLRFMVQETLDHLKFVNDRINDVEGFWLATMLQHANLKTYISSKSDRDALQYLTKIELVQDVKDPRPFSLKFHFKENPFFSDEVLEKVYELPEGVEPAPEDGSVTKNMRDFDDDPERTLESKSIKINWKSGDVDLCARHPRANTSEDGEFDGDFGSFFHYFVEEVDVLNVGAFLQGELLPDAIDYFAGRGGDTEVDYDEDEDMDELDDEDDEDDDDDEEDGSIDLEEEEEQPAKKKAKAQ